MRRHAESARRADRMLGTVILAQALTLAVSGPTSSPEYLPLRVAEAEGYFAKEGLAVTLKTTRAEPGAAEALAQGQVDLAATSLEAILRFGPRTAKQGPRLVLGLTAAPPVAGTVNAAVFMRADRRVRDRELAAFHRAVLAAESRLATATAAELAERLSSSITVPSEEFEGRLEACRALYLDDGAVTIAQVRETLTMIRAHVVLPATALVPPPEELLYAVSRRAVKPAATVR